MSSSEPSFFQEARAEGKLVVSDPPKFDLDAYIANYRGKTRALRLLHIARTSSYLYLEAFKAAVIEAKQGQDVSLYEQIVELFQQVAPSEPEARWDQSWLDKTKREINAETIRLEGELKGYKNNLIKESIRMGYEDMGKHYFATGLLGDASKSFNKEREFCQLPSHIAKMISWLINVFVEQGSWISVETNVSKLRQLPQKPAEAEKNESKLSAAAGLAQFASSNYVAAAQSFLDCNPRIISIRLEDPNSEETFHNIMSPNDIATYGALCALATMDRAELQTRVLDNAKFRNFLELEPHLRRAISAFIACKFSLCLDILESYRTDYILDIYLSRHFDEIYKLVREKSIIQYLAPYSCIKFASVAQAFKMEEEPMINLLLQLTREKRLQFRLYAIEGELREKEKDPRAEMFDEVMAGSEDFKDLFYEKMRRMDQINYGLEVKAPPKGYQQLTQTSAGADTLMGYDPGLRNSKLRSGATGISRFFP